VGRASLKHPTGKFLTIVTALIRSPTSRRSRFFWSWSNVLLINLPANLGGTIKLQCTNPSDKPLIDPQYLTTEFDILVLRESAKAMKRFVAAPAWADYVISLFQVGGLSATSDADIDDYIRGIATVFHPVGTAAMSSLSSIWGRGRNPHDERRRWTSNCGCIRFRKFRNIQIRKTQFILSCSQNSFRVPYTGPSISPCWKGIRSHQGMEILVLNAHNPRTGSSLFRRPSDVG